MQVRGLFLLLDNSISGFIWPLVEGRSQGRVFPQVRRRGFREPSSHRSAVGSIAARWDDRACGRGQGSASGRPTAQRWAPLRLPDRQPGQPGRAARRPTAQRWAPLRQRRVACTGHRSVKSSHRSAVGSIAATASASDRFAWQRVVPPLSGGLHCGWPLAFPPMSSAADVVPPLSGGLHCGMINTCDPIASILLVVPPLSGGLHCGQHQGQERSGEGAGRPTAQRWAPLRQLLPPRWCGLVPARRPTAQRWAPLRRPDRCRGPGRLLPGRPTAQRWAPLRQAA